MSGTIEFQSRVGEDGVLDLRIPLGKIDAGADVVVTIRRVRSESQPKVADPAHWYQLVSESYGSCAGLDLDRPPQGQFETREHVE